jgi:hypothetical protein
MGALAVRRGCFVGGWGAFQRKSAHTDASAVGVPGRQAGGADRGPLLVFVKGAGVASQVSWNFVNKIELKSLILAQIERWRHALHMQVERGEGATSHSVANG